MATEATRNRPKRMQDSTKETPPTGRCPRYTPTREKTPCCRWGWRRRSLDGNDGRKLLSHGKARACKRELIGRSHERDERDGPKEAEAQVVPLQAFDDTPRLRNGHARLPYIFSPENCPMIAKNRPRGCATGFDASLSRRNCRPGKQNGPGRFPGPCKIRFTLIAELSSGTQPHYHFRSPGQRAANWRVRLALERATHAAPRVTV